MACLTIAAVFTIYLFSPLWWSQLAVDAKDFYAVATLSDRGGNPYNAAQLSAEEDRLYNGAGQHTYAPTPYGYAPEFITLARALRPLGLAGFYLVLAGLVLLMGLAAFELWLSALGWEDRWLPRTAFALSAPLVLGVALANPSTLLMLAAASSLVLLVRGHPLAAGLVSAAGMIKPQIGLPLAAVVIAAGTFAHPASARARVAVLAVSGALIGGAIVVGGALATSPDLFEAWLRQMGNYAGALGPGQARSPYAQLELAGLPGLLLDRLPAPLATLLAAVVVAPLAVWALGAEWRREGIGWAPALAIGITSVLLLSPYLHLNDLVLAALPMLVLASRATGRVERAVLALWAVALPLSFSISVAKALAFGGGTSTFAIPWGVVLDVALFAALLKVMVNPSEGRSA